MQHGIVSCLVHHAVFRSVIKTEHDLVHTMVQTQTAALAYSVGVLSVQITWEDLAAAEQAVGTFGGDNRAGVQGTLHRISAIRNRKGTIVGLTCRVGRAVTGHIDMIRDMLEGQLVLDIYYAWLRQYQHTYALTCIHSVRKAAILGTVVAQLYQTCSVVHSMCSSFKCNILHVSLVYAVAAVPNSLLFLGRPGVGKTTVIREMARVLSDELHKRVVIVDTSNEIGGDGDVPHPAIGGARRMQVPDPSQQHKVMVAVMLHLLSSWLHLQFLRGAAAHVGTSSLYGTASIGGWQLC